MYPTEGIPSRYNTQCEACQAVIMRGSWVVPAKLQWRNKKLEFNSLKKPFYICGSHVETEEQGEEDGE